MKAGRFVVDTHVHAQRFAAGKAMTEQEFDPKRQWDMLGSTMGGLEPYSNAERLDSTWTPTAWTCACCCRPSP